MAEDVVGQLVAAVDALCAVDAAALTDAETIVTLHRQLERLDAVTTGAVAAFDASRAWEADGARSATAWLATRARLPESTCRRRLQRGRALRHAPGTQAAWRAGAITHAHVDALVAARTDATADAFDRDETMLVGLAGDLSWREFHRAVTYWRQLADPDGVETDAVTRHAARRLHLSQILDGMWILDGCLDPIGGAAVAGALERIDQQLFETDWAARHETTPRTPAQRRADALVEMARRAGAVPAGARLPEPLFTVLVGYETFAGRMCELAQGAVVTPGELVPWLADGWVERVVFDGPSRVTDVGVRRRIFTGATRRAVEVRDRECFHEYCDVPAERGEIDHIIPYAAGGPTVETNGRAACRFHHRRRHRPP
jgi:hypothetical protein